MAKIHMKKRRLWKVNKETNTLEPHIHTRCGRLIKGEDPPGVVEEWTDATCYACIRAWEFERMREMKK